MKKQVFFAHWRHMLQIARDQAYIKVYRDEDMLAYMSSSIIISRTCLEIYFNEMYFAHLYEGILAENDDYYSKRKKKKIKINYRSFVNLHICERLEILLPIVSNETMKDVSLQNQIRNYCIHYTTSNVKSQLESEFEDHHINNNINSTDFRSPQEVYINKKTALWCNDVALKTVIAVEEGQSKANANTEINIMHCLAIMRG